MSGTEKKKALIVIDHGSRIERANRLLEEVAERLRARGEFAIVAAAHMELASPTLMEAFDACVAAGADEVVVVPYFLAGGSHVSNDIPRLAEEAAARHAGVRWKVTEPLGLDDRLVEVVLDRARGE
jgi:sirohydrochlorin ferrochelatase